MMQLTHSHRRHVPESMVTPVVPVVSPFAPRSAVVTTCVVIVPPDALLTNKR